MKTILLTGSAKKIERLRKELYVRLKRDKIVCKDEEQVIEEIIKEKPLEKIIKKEPEIFEDKIIEEKKPVIIEEEKVVEEKQIEKIVKKPGRPRK